ncbi:hypothetical protein [Microbacterium sp. zg-YB36]|uniref:hypothetical protein n=1 Tax=Microbacterium sp. zg-YB36 TaxID=2969407 RepID=UPI00214C066B|nr:hypothetical protein [Microbacterium sp. zg-YB36]MDL5351146.1 hypothetical protein [Microbacterium sp. zg-YB36]
MSTITHTAEIEGMTLSLSIKPDWRVLGELFANARSDEQGLFLEGMVAEFGHQQMGGNMQFFYIAAGLKEEAPNVAQKAARMLTELAEHLSAVQPEVVAA